MADQVIGFAPCWYEGQNNAGLGVYIATGSINGAVYQRQLVFVPNNSSTYIWVNADGTLGTGASLPGNVFPVALIVSGLILTGTSINIYYPYLTQDPGIKSILDLRPTGTFSF